VQLSWKALDPSSHLILSCSHSSFHYQQLLSTQNNFENFHFGHLYVITLQIIDFGNWRHGSSVILRAWQMWISNFKPQYARREKGFSYHYIILFSSLSLGDLYFYPLLPSLQTLTAIFPMLVYISVNIIQFSFFYSEWITLIALWIGVQSQRAA
jgi:hypothetical protein